MTRCAAEKFGAAPLDAREERRLESSSSSQKEGRGMRASRLLFVLAFALGATGAGATMHHFTVPSIDGAQETPPNGSSATGSGVFELNDVTGIRQAVA
jgi:hypothetical protein